MHSPRPFWRETFSHSHRQEVRTLSEFVWWLLLHSFFLTNKYFENIFAVQIYFFSSNECGTEFQYIKNGSLTIFFSSGNKLQDVLTFIVCNGGSGSGENSPFFITILSFFRRWHWCQIEAWISILAWLAHVATTICGFNWEIVSWVKSAWKNSFADDDSRVDDSCTVQHRISAVVVCRPGRFGSVGRIGDRQAKWWNCHRCIRASSSYTRAAAAALEHSRQSYQKINIKMQSITYLSQCMSAYICIRNFFNDLSQIFFPDNF